MSKTRTTATLTKKDHTFTLRIRFTDGVVVNVKQGSKFKLTTSSPILLDDFRAGGPRSKAFNMLAHIETATLSDENIEQKLERFRAMALRSKDLIDFVAVANLGV